MNESNHIDLFSLFEKCTKKIPEHVALLHYTMQHEKELIKTYTFKQVYECVMRISTWIIHVCGMVQGDYAYTIIPNSPELILLYQSFLNTGIVYVPFSSESSNLTRSLQLIVDRVARFVIVLDMKILSGYSGLISRTEEIQLTDDMVVYCAVLKGGESCERLYRETNLQYIITTSGTTRGGKGGVPVRVPKSSVSCNMLALRDALGVKQKDGSVFIQVSACTFDPSIVEMTLPFISGNTVVSIPQSIVKSTEKLYQALIQCHVTHLMCTPSLLKSFSRSQFERITHPSSYLKCMVLGGEAFPIELFQGAKLAKELQLWNIYGTTECSVWATLYKLSHNDTTESKPIPIGKPLEGTEISVEMKDDYVGELWIGGTRRVCYVGDEGITPIRMRTTGDAIRKDPVTGDIFYVGRTDDQVKRLGHRIQLSSINRIISSWENVIDSEVIWHNQSLYALVILDKKFDDNYLQAQTLKHFSSWERPDRFISCDSFPMTSHGKRDKNKLRQLIDNLNRMPPSKQSAEDILGTLIGFYKPKAQDYFLAVGGTSILAVQASNKIAQAFNLQSHQETFLQLLLNKPIQCLLDAVDELCHSAKVSHKRPSRSGSNDDTKRFRGSGDDKKLALRPSWSINMEKCVDATPVVITRNDGQMVIVIGSHSGLLVAVDEQGSLVWKTKLPDRIEASVSQVSTSINGQSTFFVAVGCYDGRLYLVNLHDGFVTSFYQTQDVIKATPVWDEKLKRLWIGSYDDHIYVLTISPTGQLEEYSRLSIGCGMFSRPCLDQNGTHMFLCTLKGQILAVKRDTIETDWSCNPSGKPIFSSPVCGSGILVFGCVDGFIYGLSTNNGQVIWKYVTGGPVFSSPCLFRHVDSSAIAKDLIVIGSHSKKGFVLEIETGTLVFQTEMFPSELFSAPVAVYDKNAPSYIGFISTDGTLRLYKLGNVTQFDCVFSYTLPSNETKSTKASYFGGAISLNDIIIVPSRNDALLCFQLKDEL